MKSGGLTWRGASNFSDIEIDHRYRLLVETVLDYAIFMLDTSGNVTSWNLGAQRIKGFTPNEIIGRHFSIFYTEEDIAEHKPESLLASAASAGLAQDEGWRVRKDGSRFWADVNITAVYDESERLLGFAKITRDLTDRHRLLELERTAETAALVQRAREQEQKRIARELHDDLGQQIAALRMSLSCYEAEHPDSSPDAEPRGRVTLEEINRQLESMATSVRRIAANLRPPILDDLGLDAAIEWLAQDFSQLYGLRVRCRIEAPTDVLNEQAAITLYRVAQEALTNVVKHARARQVTVKLRSDAHCYELRIEDDGVGLQQEAMPRADAFGILGMRERILQLGGILQIESRPGSGVSILARVPIENACSVPKPP